MVNWLFTTNAGVFTIIVTGGAICAIRVALFYHREGKK